MKFIRKKKIFNGNVELRDYEVERFKKTGVRVWVNDEFMDLSPKDLRLGKIINTQYSRFNLGQTYKLVGFPWNPNGKQKELFNVNINVFQRIRENHPELVQKLRS